MSKKIVVITGSPRKKGNSFAMTEAFIRAAEEKGHTVTRFDAAVLAKLAIKRTKHAPLTMTSIPAQIKGVIDRIYSLVVGGKDIAGKECALIACCEEEDLSVLDGVRIPMERTAALNKWKMVGEVLIPGVLNVGDIEKTDGCQQAAALANKI